jgi:SH3-like domain-containing protein
MIFRFRILPVMGAASLLLSGDALAQDGAQDGAQDSQDSSVDRPVRIVEDVPRLTLPQAVSASQTPSGLAVPRFVSLKVGRANCRIGPSRGHRVEYRYERRGMPLMVVAETEQWRRVRDVNGDECWIKATGLSGAKRAVVTQGVELRAKPKMEAKLRAVAEKGTVLELGECRDGWCEVRTLESEGARYKGWALQARLWGAARLR